MGATSRYSGTQLERIPDAASVCTRPEDRLSHANALDADPMSEQNSKWILEATRRRISSAIHTHRSRRSFDMPITCEVFLSPPGSYRGWPWESGRLRVCHEATGMWKWLEHYRLEKTTRHKKCSSNFLCSNRINIRKQRSVPGFVSGQRLSTRAA